MNIIDEIVVFNKKIVFMYGTLKARVLVKKLGRRNLIHFNIDYLQPSKILIENDVEIRQFTTLDARTNEEIGISISSGSRIKENVAIICSSGFVSLSKQVLIGRNSVLLGHGGIQIGEKTMIGPNCNIVASNHFFSLKGIDFQDQGFSKEPIIIGRNAWIGASTTILGSSEIENDVVVAAGSVVNSRLSSGNLYGGVPAKRIRELTENEVGNKETYFKNWDTFRMQK